ncbi:predicted protein [Naegleria gruberi]|uniref:Predicted protein n=1 Tax=Naegleria gruberi TaxID=5762 RepID=D2V9Q7_NAEGR|nr:uncharacterized protein NAEGRDRAFT_65523 [Naegleria gruberi]EFC46507.1 predicted protein [Naegleria gruberi]|eukprot:XP_002679251.1 predicted protein [Naegleria gruberi strain NEG-M]
MVELSEKDVIAIAVSSSVGGVCLFSLLLSVTVYSIYLYRRRRTSQQQQQQQQSIPSMTTPLLQNNSNNLNNNNSNNLNNLNNSNNSNNLKKQVNLQIIKEGIIKSCIQDKEGILVKSSIAKDLPRLVKKTILYFNGNETFSNMEPTVKSSPSKGAEGDINFVCCKFLAELSKCVNGSQNGVMELSQQDDQHSSYGSNTSSSSHYSLLAVKGDLDIIDTSMNDPMIDFKRRSTRMLMNTLNNISNRTNSPDSSSMINVQNFETFSIFLKEVFGEQSPVVNILKLCSQTALFEGLNQLRPALMDVGIMFKDFRGKNWTVKIYTNNHEHYLQQQQMILPIVEESNSPSINGELEDNFELPTIIHERIEQVINMQLQNLFTFTYQLQIVMDEHFQSVHRVQYKLLSIDFSKSNFQSSEKEEYEEKIKSVFQNVKF